MPDPIPDDLFAQSVRQHLMATDAQLDSAAAFQADALRQGQRVGLADALVKLGIITLAQRDTLEQRLVAQQRTGLARLLHYRLLRKVGEGAMGAVYLAQDERADRQVAIKVLPRSAAARPGFVEWFQREADAAGRLNHPNLVRAFSFGEDQGWYFFVMEYCDGETQDRRLKRDGFYPADEATAIVLQVARALQYAHDRGVIHRDVKPSNIILARDGTAKILDLGLSKNLHDEKAAFLTQSGMTVGTPHYMAPEQARGDRDVDGRADIYSLGSTFYHFVTGDTPFHGSSAFEIVTKHMTAELPDPRDIREEIPDGVVQIIRTMMAKRKEDRYVNCGALATDLERVLKGEAPKAQSLDAGKSSVAMPRVKRAPRLLRPARTGVAAVSAALREPRRGRRVGSRATAYAILGGLALAVLIPVAFLVFGSGPRAASRAASPKPAPAADPATPSPKPVPPPPKPAPDAQDAAAMRDLRETSARRQLEDLQALERGGTLPLPDLLRRYEGFVSSYGDTRAGAEARGTFDKLRAEESMFGSGPVTDAWLQAVRKLPPEGQFQRVLQKLQALNPGWGGHAPHVLGPDGVTELDFTGAAVRNLTPLLALPSLRSLLCTQSLVDDLSTLAKVPIERLVASRTEITTLAPLRGKWLTKLDVYGTKIADLSPLIGMSLESLLISETPVADLAPLQGMPLRELQIQNTRVRDLAPLRGMPLRMLRTEGTAVSDLGPLAGAPLEQLSCEGTLVDDLSPVKDAPLRSIKAEFLLLCRSDFLSALPTLKTVNGTEAAEFWPATKAMRAFLKDGPALPSEAAWAQAVDLLPLSDPSRDAIAGTWVRRSGGWASDDTAGARLVIPWKPPAEYDLRVEFVRHKGAGDVCLLLARGDVRFAAQLAAYRNELFGFSRVAEYALASNPTRSRVAGGLENGRRYVAVVLVRKEGLKLYLDGRLVSAWPTDYSDLEPDTVWRTRGAPVLGLGSNGSPVVFQRVVVREVSGKGALFRAPAEAPPPSGSAVPAPGNGTPEPAWNSLFDGSGLAGWDAVGKPVPRVEDGALVLEGAEVQRRIGPADFELAGAVKMIRGAPVNCGSISFRRPGSARSGTGLLFHSDGDVHLFVDRDRTAKAGSGTVSVGRWHPFRLRVAGTSVELEVDGRIVLRGAVPGRPAGNLALYAIDDKAAIAFKDLRLRGL